MSWTDAFFPLAVAALLLVVFIALRHRILAVVATRNALRRKRQSALVVLGLLVGTAIVSAALVAGDSMEYAIVEATYDAFQEIDELVFLDGYAFYPQSVADSLAADPELARATDAVGANILWNAAVTNERTDQYEPGLRLVGFDPAEVGWGAFRAGDRRHSGADLAPDEVVLLRDAANVLDARVGDRLTVNFSRPIDPLLPTFDAVQGRLNVSAGGLLGTQTIDPVPYTRAVQIEGTIVQLSVALGWDPGTPAQDLDLQIRSPSGRVFGNANGTVGAPDGTRERPVVVNITGSLAEPLERGDWIVSVTGEAAAQTDFGLLFVQLEPVFDLAVFQERVNALRERFPDVDPSSFADATPRETRTVTVAFIADGGKGPNFKLPTALNMFVRLDTLQDWLGRPGEVNLVKVSNHGGIVEGGDASDAVFPLLYARLNATKAESDHPAVLALKAGKDKQFWLEQARRIGETFSVFLTFVGSFSIIAGLLLIVNIFTMLAEERKTELGISRAVGLKRDHLTRLFVLEGAMYALPAAAIGTLAGVGLAAGLIAGFNAFGDPATFPAIPFRIEGASLALAFAIGILLTLGTVYVAARRVSRLNVVRAIRNIEEPEISRGRVALWAGAILTAGGVAYTTWAYVADSFSGQVLGPTVLALGLAALLRRLANRKGVYPILALLLFAYLTATLFLIKKYDSVEGNVFGPIRAVLMDLCVVVFVVYTEATARVLASILRRVPGFGAVAAPATSYPLHKKFRAALTLSMFAVILLVVSLFSIFGSLFQPDPAKEAGGYDVQGFATVPFDRLEDRGTDPGVLSRIERYDVVPYYLQVGGTLVKVEGEMTGQFGPPQDFIYGIDAAFADANRFTILRRDPAFATDADAYRAVANSEDLAIVGYSYSTDENGNDKAHGVGDDLTIEAKGGLKHFRIVGITEQYHFKGVFVSQPALDSMFSDRDTLVLIKLRAGEDPVRAAHDIEAAYRDVGLDASSIRHKVLEESEQFRMIFTLIQLFLSLGLIVGVLSLGIVTSRNVIERRQEIGMLRALGYRKRDIRRVFLVEMWTTVLLGILIGAALAVLVSFGLWVAIVRELRIGYSVPWFDLAVIALIAFVATTLATLSPIVRASRVPPAEALRYIE